MNPRESGEAHSEPALSRSTTRAARTWITVLLGSILGVGVCSIIVFWLMVRAEVASAPAEDRVFARVQSDDPFERVKTLREVVQVAMADTGRSIPIVIESLKDREAIVRVQAAHSLAMLGAYAVQESDSGATRNENSALAIAVTSALVTRLAEDNDSMVRAAAAASLQNISVASPRAAAASKRGSEKSKGAPGESTTASKSPVDLKAIIGALTAGLADRDDEVRTASAVALGDAGPKASAEPPQR